MSTWAKQTEGEGSGGLEVGGELSRVTTVTFVRHTDVENPDEIFYGRLRGYGLSSIGREQAARTAEVLAEVPVSAVFTSPMLRARQTARIISEPHRLRPKATWLLAEVRTGWQGRPFAELDAIGFDFYSMPLGPREESLASVWSRIDRFTSQVRESYPGGTILAVTHGDICMLARAGYLGLPLETASIRLPHIYSGKGSLTRVQFSSDLSGSPRVDYFDPNGDAPRWSTSWTMLDKRGARID
jgi:probable phosphoglycerate mutase